MDRQRQQHRQHLHLHRQHLHLHRLQVHHPHLNRHPHLNPHLHLHPRRTAHIYTKMHGNDDNDIHSNGRSMMQGPPLPPYHVFVEKYANNVL